MSGLWRALMLHWVRYGLAVNPRKPEKVEMESKSFTQMVKESPKDQLSKNVMLI